MNILLNWIKPNSKFGINFWIEFSEKKGYCIIFWIEYFWKNDIEKSFELNFIMKWMNESYFESIFAIFDEKPPFLSILDTFWAIFGHFSYSTSINDSLTIELNYLLNWISRIFLNWIIFWIESWVKQYWIEYWTKHFLAKFKHWIESDRVSPTPMCVCQLYHGR